MNVQQLIALLEADAQDIENEIIKLEGDVAPYLHEIELFLPEIKTVIDKSFATANAEVDKILVNVPPALKTAVDNFLSAVEAPLE